MIILKCKAYKECILQRLDGCWDDHAVGVLANCEDSLHPCHQGLDPPLHDLATSFDLCRLARCLVSFEMPVSPVHNVHIGQGVGTYQNHMQQSFYNLWI
jgi:hypothetical protein